MPQNNTVMNETLTTVGAMVLERPACKRSMPKGRAVDDVDRTLMARNVLNDDGRKPAVMGPIRAAAATLGCSDEEAVTRSLELVIK